MKTKILIIGKFNVIHIGHIRLFSYAKKIAKHLIIGIINDKNSKSEIMINQNKRLDAVKSNKFVDEAYVIDDNLNKFILKHKPHYLLKGKEFENQKNLEKKILNKIKCKLIFGSGDEQLSSSDIIKDELNSSLINNISNDYEYFKRNRLNKNNLNKIIKNFKNIKALVVGENIIDRYIITQPLGMSHETSLVVHRPEKKKDFLGGASIVAMHLSSIIKKTDYLSLIEKKDKYNKFINYNLKKNKINSHFVEDETFKTVIKTRYRLDNSTIFRTNEFLNFSLTKNLENKILNKFKKLIKNKDLLIISDFNYGFLPKKLVIQMIKIAKKINSKIVITGDSQTSSQIGDISKFKGIDLITPTETEARRFITNSSVGLAAISREILSKLKLKNLIITLNKNGVLIDTKRNTDKINSLAKVVQDTAGAGDAFLTYVSLALATKANIWESSYLGSVASAIHVNNIGNEKIDFEVVRDFINNIE